MVFIPFSPASYPQPSFFILGILFPYVFVLACVGVALGYGLERVRGGFVIVGSAAYWAAAFILIFYYSSAVFWSMFLVLFADVTYAIRYVVGRHRETAASVSLGLRNRLTLIIAVAFVLVGFVLWLTWSSNAPSSSFTLLLQGCAVALVIWVLLADGDRHLEFARFVGKGFVVSFLLTFFLWFVDAWFAVSWVLSSVLWILGYSFGFRVVPFSLLPVAICVTAYGVSRKQLPAWIILLSSWYVSIYGVYAAYDVWWLVYIFPYLSGPPYFGSGGLIARDMLLVFIAFVVALIFTCVYVWIRKPRQSPPI